MFASTYTPPCSTQSLPTSGSYRGVIEALKPPYAYRIVGLAPSRAIDLGCTMKYGIFVPSFDVASICSTMLRDASNRGASVLSCDAVPRAASASQMLLGVRNPVTLTNASFVFESVPITLVDTLSGRVIAVWDHDPSGARVATSTLPFTFWYTSMRSLSLVAETPSTDSRGPGSKMATGANALGVLSAVFPSNAATAPPRIVVAPFFQSSYRWTITCPPITSAKLLLAGTARRPTSVGLTM